MINTYVTDPNARSTDRECSACENGLFLRIGHELFCGTCGFAPEVSGKHETETAWDEHRKQIVKKESGLKDGRPKLVGGYEEAYWGDGEYSFNISKGQFVV